MSSKKALIVDDSKLAQFVLKKMLVEHELIVETTESAEEALEYLATEKPDVIFLDHSMAGMNGLQALKAIKDNPATATIPVMMYTSQDDGVYMSQARALGAIDILPKQLKPVELAQVLERLHLTHSEDEEEAQPKTIDTEADEVTTLEFDEPITSENEELSELVRNAEAALEKESLKQFLKVRLDNQQRQVIDSLAAINKRLDEISELAKGERRRQSRDSSSTPILYIAGLVIIAILLFFIFNAIDKRPVTVTERTATPDIAQPIPRSDTTLTQQGIIELQSALEASLNSNNQIPPNEVLMSDRVTQALLNILGPLETAGFAGTITITGHTGDFCQISDAQGKLSIAPPDALYNTCQVIEPIATVEDLSTPELREFVNEINNDERYKFDVRLEVAGSLERVVNYPNVEPTLTAGEWNQAAQYNNRVIFAFVD